MSRKDTNKQSFDNPNYVFSKNRDYPSIIEEDGKAGIELPKILTADEPESEDDNRVEMESKHDNILDDNDKAALIEDDDSKNWLVIIYLLRHISIDMEKFHIHA